MGRSMQISRDNEQNIETVRIIAHSCFEKALSLRMRKRVRPVVILLLILCSVWGQRPAALPAAAAAGERLVTVREFVVGSDASVGADDDRGGMNGSSGVGATSGCGGGGGTGTASSFLLVY